MMLPCHIVRQKDCNLHLNSVYNLQEDDYAVSPSSPLVSTALDDNGWVCGEYSWCPRCYAAASAKLINA